VILDLPRFAAAERPFWTELETLLQRRGSDANARWSVEDIERFHYLYERCAADLARLDPYSAPQLRTFLEALVSRAYCEIHETRSLGRKIAWKDWLVAFPRAFRRRFAAFALSLAVTLAGCAFGTFAIRTDPEAKAVIMPFEGLNGKPADRVKEEEHAKLDRLHGHRATFSAQLMTHNIRVTLLTMAMGLTWGVGTLLLIFYNGVILGAVGADYVAGGQTTFLLGWLLPHGAVEIPSILFGGQAGFVIASALIGWGERKSRADRLRAVAPDLFAIAAGAGVMLIWAGIVESFISQYHKPVLPYELKIGFGVVESAALWLYLGLAGRR
jgi:uncharacterized membrane protein SpoIIM required for sporulation